jgi:putative transposase
MDPIDIIEHKKIKRFFRAKHKLIHPKIISHITQRAAGKEPSFIEDDDYICMLSLMKEVSEKHAIDILAFCLMPNHIHLLLKPKEKNLDQSMQTLFSRYAAWFNRKYERKGHLFGGPYRQAICLDYAYLIAVSVYIHLNPVKAKLIENPLHYRWSSVSLYCKQDAPAAFVNPDFILRLLSEDIPESKIMYLKTLNKGIDLNVGRVLEEEDAIEKFRSNLIKIFPNLFHRANKKKPAVTISGQDLLSLEELEKQSELMKKAGIIRRPETQKARKFLIEQLVARGYKHSEIAEKLAISPKTIYNIIKSS